MISEKIVKEFGGKINLNSVVGQGTTFTFNIKLPETLVENKMKDYVSCKNDKQQEPEVENEFLYQWVPEGKGQR